MKLILTDDVADLGAPGDIVEVKDGYGRNYLLPARAGRCVATRGAREAGRRDPAGPRSPRAIRDLGHAQEVERQLGGLSSRVKAKAAGDSGRLFGSVTAADVVDAVRAAGGPALDRRAVDVPARSSPSASTLSRCASTRRSPPNWTSRWSPADASRHPA